MQFKDQSAAEHKFEIKKGTTVVKAFVFSKIKSIADRTLEGGTVFVSAPVCNTALVYVQFNQMKYRKTGSASSADDYNSPLPFYEYQLPAGWTMTGGYIGSSSTPGLVVGNNSVSIQPNFFSSDDIKVRAINTECGDFNKSQWRIIPTNRPVLNLKANNAETISLNCGDNRPITFTIENGSSATCANFEWDVVNRGWLNSSGNPITSIITTTSPTLTLIPVNTLANPPRNVVVTIKAGSEQLKDSVVVNFTNTPPSPLIIGEVSICSSRTYLLQTSSGFPLLGNATWTASPSTLVTLVPNPANSKQVVVNRNGTSAGILALTANYTYPACNTNINIINNYLTVGTPKASAVSKVETPEGEIYLTVTLIPGATYNFYEGGILMAENSDNHYLTFVPCNTGKIVQFETVNECGVSAKSQTGVSRTCSGGAALIVSPNPSPTSVNITLVENSTSLIQSNSSTNQKDIHEVQLINKQGVLVKRQQYPPLTKFVSLDISNLDLDIYTVRVFDGTQWYSEQIIKN